MEYLSHREGTQQLERWWASLVIEGQDPQTFVMSVGLIVLDGYIERFPLDEEYYVSPGNRLRSSGARIQQILQRHGEFRNFTREGGRTTSGAVVAARALASRLNSVDSASKLTDAQRRYVFTQLQRRIVSHVRDFFERQRIEIEIDLSKPGPLIIHDIIQAAGDKAGAVAQHLVGAKLVERYPETPIENHSSTTADTQLGRPGDFLVGDTAFHVTVAPSLPVIDRCEANLRDGYRAFLLVSQNSVEAASQMARNAGLESRIWIIAIESFVGQNIEELGGFARDSLAVGLKRLLETYNTRVSEAEVDRSLGIEIPANL